MSIINSIANQVLTSTSTPLFANATSSLVSTATAGATTTLTAASAQTQLFTGSTTQTVVMPVVSTLNLGQIYRIINNSSGVVTVQSSGLNTIQAMAANTSLLLICISTSGTGISSWQAVYNPNSGFTFPLEPSLGGTGISNSNSNTLTISAVSSINQNVTTTGTPSFTSSTSGNINTASNTISSSNTNGVISLIPNGSGGVLVGSSTSITGLTASLQIAQGGQAPLLAIGSYKNTTGSFLQQFYKSRSTTIGSFTTVNSGDALGQFQFYGDDGAAFRQAVNITATAQGTISSGIVPGQIAIQTANTSGTLTTALTISNAQVVTLANALPVSSGGTGIQTTTAYGLIAGGTTATGAFQNVGAGTSGQFLTSGGSSALPTWTTATFPATAGAAGTILRSNGTNWVNSTSTYPDTVTSGNIIYASGTNAIGQITSGTGVVTALGQNVTGSGGIVLATSPTTSGQTLNAVHALIELAIAATGAALNGVVMNNDNDGVFAMQAGVGSAASGGGYTMFGKNHATYPGWTKACISSQTGSKFAVNTQGWVASGSDIFTVDRVGAVVASSSVTATAFSPSSTSGIIGTTTNDNAAAGSVGQLISSVILVASAISLTTSTQTDVTSINLTAGDWDIWGNVSFSANGGVTNISRMLAWSNTTSATFPDTSLIVGTQNAAAGVIPLNSFAYGTAIAPQRISTSGATTVYLSVYADFSVSTLSVSGGIYARRRR